LTQTSTKNATIISAQELIGNITIAPGLNNVYSFFLNPIDPAYTGTRLSQLAGSFQKYRFKKIMFRVMTNLPTTVGGTLTTGYCENPDQGITTTSFIEAQQAIFALDGANISNLWVHNMVHCKIRDPKWYNIDPDSTEPMMTTQGTVYLLPSGDINITGEVQIPVVLDYTIEFTGAAKQKLATPDIGFYLSFTFPTFWEVSTVTGFTGDEYFWISKTQCPGYEAEFDVLWNKYHNSPIVSPSNYFNYEPNSTISNTTAVDGDATIAKCQVMTSATNGTGVNYLVVRFFNQSLKPIVRILATPPLVCEGSPAIWVYTDSSPSLAKRRLNLVRALHY